MVISIISDGAFIAEFNFPPPYFKAPNNNPAGIVANGLFAAINDTAIPSNHILERKPIHLLDVLL